MRFVFHTGERPGPGWHRHGTTERTVLVIEGQQLLRVRVRKQRWLEVETGRTVHDRPPWEVPWASGAFAVVFHVAAAWLLSGRGLHHVDWPWIEDRPSRRTAQRWLDRLRAHALRWQVALRGAVLDYLAPRPLEEILPTGGIPPPEGRQRRNQQPAPEVWQLYRGLWLTRAAAQHLDIPVYTLLVEARRRFLAESAMHA